MEAKTGRARTFRSQALFRAWLETHHRTVAELIVRCFKVEHAKRGLTYRQALDEALCFGWIDGVRHALDEHSFTVRFTPRKPRSGWSKVNVKRAEELRALGRLRPAGLEAFKAGAATAYSYESAGKGLSRPLLARLRANEKAWRFFNEQPAWYQRVCAHWVMSGKRDETRERRFASLVSSSEAGERVPPLRRKGA
jgi:uncharacterized protein YdeI (YjbR/CyaY-like superfamily)